MNSDMQKQKTIVKGKSRFFTYKKNGISDSGITIDKKSVDGPYAKYVLFVLMLVYVFNFIDRQILSILAEDIKADLGISDADLGFLFGTAFAVFYATFGIMFGRLADIWNRKKLIAIGLFFWSLMTALSGTARGLLPLALCRFGVGVGESSASPAAFSILYDYFSPKVRTTVLAIYSSGVYIGMGLGLFLGGMILDTWNGVWPDFNHAPFGLKGWQATFMIVGLPGVLMALWVSTLREPVRGQSDNIFTEPHPYPFREAAKVLISMIPIFNLWTLGKNEKGRRSICINLIATFSIAVVTFALIRITGNALQWVALGVGVYAVTSWAQMLAVRDPVVFGMMFMCKTLRNVIFAGGTTTFMGIALSFWSVPFFQRYYGVSASEVGVVLGAASATMGFFGIIVGGLLADRLRVYTAKGKLIVWLCGVVVAMLSVVVFLTADSLILAYAGVSTMYLAIAMGHGPLVATVNDLVLPRARATTSAFSLMVATFIGVALGPYVIGHISDVITTSGVSEGEALRQAMLWSLLLPVIGLVLVVQALQHVESDEGSILTRAQLLGEKI